MKAILTIIEVYAGEPVYKPLKRAQGLAKTLNQDVTFTFNYIDTFTVKPDGTWTCERKGGGMPIMGPNSEFVPPEGWNAFYGH